VNYAQSISAPIFCCVDLAYRKRGDWSCRSPLLLTLFFPFSLLHQYLVKAGRARPKWWAIGRSVSLCSLPPRPQHQSHQKKLKSDATVEGGQGWCNPIWFCLVDFFTSSSKRKRSSSSSEKKRKRRRKTLRRNKQPNDIDSGLGHILEKSKVLPSALAVAESCIGLLSPTFFRISPGRIIFISNRRRIFTSTPIHLSPCWRVIENNLKVYVHFNPGRKIGQQIEMHFRRDLCYWSFVSHWYNELEKSVDETHTHGLWLVSN
jgi:hypothetical protein